jgi:hypothetical protein
LLQSLYSLGKVLIVCYNIFNYFKRSNFNCPPTIDLFLGNAVENIALVKDFLDIQCILDASGKAVNIKRYRIGTSDTKYPERIRSHMVIAHRLSMINCNANSCNEG